MLAWAVVCVKAQGSGVLYEHKFDSESSLEKWVVADVNQDGSTWKYSDMEQAVRYMYNTYNDGDDWLISPAVAVPAAGYYKISYTYQGSSYGERMDIYYGDSQEVSAMSNRVVDLGTFSHENPLLGEAMVYIDKPGNIHWGFHAYSEKGMYKIVLYDFQVSEASGVDMSLAEIKSPVTGWNLKQEPVTVVLKNNGKDPVRDFTVGYDVDGQNAVRETYSGEIPGGASAEFTFKTAVDLSAPRKVFDIRAWTELESDDLAGNDTCRVSVKNNAEAGVPYYTSFEDEGENALIKFFNIKNDEGSWGLEKNGGWSYFSRTGDWCLMYAYDKNNDADDWAILEPVSLQPGYYSFKFWYASMGDHRERLEVYVGKEQTPEAMKTQVAVHNPFIEEEYVESASVVRIEEAGQYYFGFHALSEKDMNIIVIDDVSIEEIRGDAIDVAVMGTVSPENGYVRDQTSKDLVFAVSNRGISDVENVKVKAFVDGREVLGETISMKAQETVRKTVEKALDLAPGTYSLKIELTCEGDADTSDNLYESQFVVVGKPVALWNFESGQIPQDFRFVNYDGVMIHTSMQDELFDNNGWGVIELNYDENNPYGHYMMGLVSYLEDDTRSDKWAILPVVKVNSENAHLVWTANSVDADFPEYYEVLVADAGVNLDEFNPSPFFTKLVVQQENPATAPATRGISLDSYAGKDICIAFRLRTESGYMLTMDNIGLYGDVVSTGLNEVRQDTGQLRVLYEDGVLKLTGNDGPADLIRVLDVTGMEVACAEKVSELVLTSLEQGVYVAVVTLGDRVYTCKFLKNLY